MASTFRDIYSGLGLRELNKLHRRGLNVELQHPCWKCPFNRQLCQCSAAHHEVKEMEILRTKLCMFNRSLLDFDSGRRCLKSSFKRQMQLCNAGHHDVKEKDISRATLIWRAVKLPIYSVALVPLTVGTAASYLQTGVVSAGRYFMLLASSILIITWLNLSNDVYDYDTGADKEKKESVVNMVGSRTGALIAAYALLALGFLGLVMISLEAGSFRSLLLFACSIACGYIYQCPPFRLSYQGLGEPLCFAAFGPFATTAFYLMQRSRSSSAGHLSFSPAVHSASLLVGLTTTLILFCSHFHQVEGDRAVGKMSPLVRVGTMSGSRVVKVAIITLYSVLLPLTLSNALPLTCMLCCGLTFPMGMLVMNYVGRNHKDPRKMFMAKYYCVRLHSLFGAALSAGLAAARIMGR